MSSNLMAYVTGGLALTRLGVSNSFSDNVPLGAGTAGSANASATKAGWVVGGGLEYALIKNWSIKAEYLFMDFGKVTATGTIINTAGPGSDRCRPPDIISASCGYLRTSKTRTHSRKPLSAMNHWFDHILYNTLSQPESPAMVMEDRVVTYRMLGIAIENSARRIASLDIAKGGLVAICIENPDPAFYALPRAASNRNLLDLAGAQPAGHCQSCFRRRTWRRRGEAAG